MSYSDRFQKALERTASFGLPAPDVAGWEALKTSTTDLKQHVLAILALTGSTPFDMIGRCVNASILVHDLLRSRAIAEPLITIGNVSVDGQSQFKITEESLRKELQRGFNPDVPDEMLNVHVWLTFPDMTRLDTTIKSSFAWHSKRRRLQPEDSLLVLDGKTKNSRFEFFPLLVGTGFLQQTLAQGAAGRCQDITPCSH